MLNFMDVSYEEDDYYTLEEEDMVCTSLATISHGIESLIEEPDIRKYLYLYTCIHILACNTLLLKYEINWYYSSFSSGQ